MASSDINSVVIVGRLTRDAEVRYLGTGTAVANISIAVNRSRREGDRWISEGNFFDVTYFGKGAEAIKPYLTKGKQIAVQGSLRQDRWQDKNSGETRSRVTILADSVQLLSGNGAGGSSGFGAGEGGMGSYGGFQKRNDFDAPQGYSQQNYSGAPMAADSGNGFAEDSFVGDSSSQFPEDIPF
ncbi:MAG: single-stranded DNA-binding protein [Treponema sp.]|nr:single-stranded DNA-binding protein [Treponema sp.]